MAAAHTVTAALVVALVGGKVQHLYHGDVVPSNIDEGSLANLKSLGFISSEDEDVSPDPESQAGERPNESGPGSAKEKWLAYAAFHQVEVDPAGSKDDIIAAVTTAGH